MKESLQQKIIEMLECASPLAAEEIACQSNIVVDVIKHELKILGDKGKVSEKDGLYYPNMRYKMEDIRKIQEETVAINENAKNELHELKETVEHLQSRINGIYVNFITMMSVFVAIFSLITINANITFDFVQKNMREIFLGIIVVNIFVVFCIIVLLFCIRFIIIKPMNEKKRKQKNQ